MHAVNLLPPYLLCSPGIKENFVEHFSYKKTSTFSFLGEKGGNFFVFFFIIRPPPELLLVLGPPE